MISLQEKFRKEAIPAMQKKFGYKNIYAVPSLKKIVLNSGVGKMVQTRKGSEEKASEEKIIEDLVSEFALIAGQKPEIIRARKSIAGFKLRKGMVSGVRVTLRGVRMYDFLTRLIHVALPRMRDFRGIEEKAVDRNGHITIGIREQIIFPEIPHDKARSLWGMEVTIVTSARNKEEGVELLRQLGMPFRK
jgi:large subunit ribosomal protein L5